MCWPCEFLVSCCVHSHSAYHRDRRIIQQQRGAWCSLQGFVSLNSTKQAATLLPVAWQACFRVPTLCSSSMLDQILKVEICLSNDLCVFGQMGALQCTRLLRQQLPFVCARKSMQMLSLTCRFPRHQATELGHNQVGASFAVRMHCTSFAVLMWLN